jgi:hypothetical protein
MEQKQLDTNLRELLKLHFSALLPNDKNNPFVNKKRSHLEQ